MNKIYESSREVLRLECGHLLMRLVGPHPKAEMMQGPWCAKCRIHRAIKEVLNTYEEPFC